MKPAVGRKLSAIGYSVGSVLLLGAVGVVVWFGCEVLKAASGECSPEDERVNAACARVESDKDLRFECSTGTGIREWGSCGRRNQFSLSWDRAPDSGWQSDPHVLGWVGEVGDVDDGGPWTCSDGEHRLALYPNTIPAGEEDQAAIAFGRACARFRDGSVTADAALSRKH